MAVKQSFGDKVAEKVVDGVNVVKDFANGGYKDTSKNMADTAKTVGDKVAETAKVVSDKVVEGAKKACDFAVEKVFQREGETVEEAKARIKRGEFGVAPEEENDEIIIEGADEEVVVEEVPADTTDEQ